MKTFHLQSHTSSLFELDPCFAPQYKAVVWQSPWTFKIPIVAWRTPILSESQATSLQEHSRAQKIDEATYMYLWKIEISHLVMNTSVYINILLRALHRCLLLHCWKLLFDLIPSTTSLATALQQPKSKPGQHDLLLAGLWRCPRWNEFPWPCSSEPCHPTSGHFTEHQAHSGGQGLCSVVEWEAFPPPGRPSGMWMRSQQQRPAEDPALLHLAHQGPFSFTSED